MIIISLRGGFGNHLMTYFLACILADKYNDNENFNLLIHKTNDNKQTQDTQNTIFKVIKNIKLNNFVNRNHNNIYIHKDIEYLNVLNGNTYCKNNTYILDLIHLNDMNFFLENILTIKKYLNFNYFETDDNTIVLSLRLGMGENEVAKPSPYENELRLPFEYYEKAFNYFKQKNSNVNKIIICSDNFENQYINFFNKINGFTIELYKKNTLQQFELFINAKNLILSNSTFSILAALFNDNNITTPIFVDSGSPFPGEQNKRYRKILNVEKPNCHKIEI